MDVEGRKVPRAIVKPHTVDGQVVEPRGRNAGRFTESVSYTYFRAHVTVLDFVCLLLLENI